MVVHEFQKEIDSFIQTEIFLIKDRIKHTGQVKPHISILYYDAGVLRPMEIPIPLHIMNSGAGKDHLVNTAIPTLLKFFVAAGRTIICFHAHIRNRVHEQGFHI